MSFVTCRAAGGWVAGCGAATAIICATALLTITVTAPAPPRVPSEYLRVGLQGMLILMPLVFVITCLLTGIPAALTIWLSRRFRIRSFLFFGCVGAATGALSQGLLFQSFSAVTWLFVVAGFVAGLTYWFIAGRQAGQDRQVSGDPA
jgi:xanthosine utilization system XapX-like protein